MNFSVLFSEDIRINEEVVQSVVFGHMLTFQRYSFVLLVLLAVYYCHKIASHALMHFNFRLIMSFGISGLIASMGAVGVERHIATVWVQHYVGRKRIIGTTMVIVTFLGCVCLSIVVNFVEFRKIFDLRTTYTTCLIVELMPEKSFLAFGLAITICLCSALWQVVLFRRNFVQKANRIGIDPLAVRFQQSENVHTTKMIVPIFVVYTIMCCIGLALSTTRYYLMKRADNMLLAKIIMQSGYLLIDFSVITCMLFVLFYHPTLRFAVCRKCRIEALRNVGLRMFGNSLIVQSADGYPVSDVEEEDVPDESSPSTSQNVSPAPKPSNQQEQLSSLYIDSILKKIPNLSSFKELYKVVEAFLIFECNQRLICSMHQGHPIKDFESIPIDKCKQFELETASLQLGKEMVQKLVTNCFLTSEPEIALMITIAHKAFLTSRVFPTPGDTRVAYFVGFHLDISHLETFLNNQTDYERIRKVAWPLISKRFEVAERCRLLRPDIVEWSAFIGILLFEELARITPDNSLINQKRETLYAEFFQVSLFNRLE
ncbi:hypothetical protein M3Y94_00274700 [Aphelenchoides besseyi]|nr:hypothetical protein M3Y94_00274700 [Aphelenchoides besseyi]